MLVHYEYSRDVTWHLLLYILEFKIINYFNDVG